MQKKLFLNLVIVLFIGIFVCGLLSFRIIENYYHGNIEKTLVSNAILISDLVGKDLVENKIINANEYLGKIKHIVNARITVIDKNGVVISDTEYSASKMDNHKDRPEVKAAMVGTVGKVTRHSATLKVDFLYVAQPIYLEGKIDGVLRLSMPLYEVQSLMNKLYTNVFISIIAGLIIAMILGYSASVRITRPINEINYVASRIAKGEFEKRINIESKDEIGELAGSINSMAVTLNDTISNLNDKNLKLEAIMASVINGIIAIDNEEKILFINPVAMRMLDITNEDVIGKHFLQVARNNQIDNYLKHIITEKDYSEAEILMNYQGERILKFNTNPIMLEDGHAMGIIVSVQDVTELRKLERMRSEFVANVSHELKTPLTSIKGFVETLRSGALEDKDTAERFLGIIEDETDRLNRLISDTLSLSELENKRGIAVSEKIQVRDLIYQVVSMLNSQAEKKGITLTSHAADDLGILIGDPDNIKQMLINLVDNAIKYTSDHGMVQVKAYNKDNNIILQVADNGIGISQENIPRLFERFYRVDKARSRRVGGTGLGLAIVKHIVKLFDGEIQVESEIGKGTKFTITLPIKYE